MRRHLLTIAIFLLAGAVLNVAVAWAITAGMTWPQGLSRSSTIEREEDWPRPVPDHWPERSAYTIQDGASGWRLDRYSKVWAGIFAINIANAGWPCHALESETWFEMPTGIWSSWGITPPVNMFGFGPQSPKTLPVRPIWPGFIANTLFYATLLWLLTCLAIAVRRFLRLGRGLCPQCAYPMGGSAVCSECGNELPQRVRAAT